MEDDSPFELAPPSELSAKERYNAHAVERQHAIHERRRAASECVVCGAPDTPAGTYCSDCRARFAAKARRQYAAGMRQPSQEPEKVEKRKSYNRQHARQLREERRADGLCPNCGMKPAPPGQCCPDCKAKTRDTSQKWRDKQPPKPPHPETIPSSRERLNPRTIDLTGQRFGRLTVLGFYDRRNHAKRWECRCDCGVVKPIFATQLRRGGTLSCGCHAREESRKRRLGVANKDRIPDHVYAQGQLLKSYRKNAENRGLPWELADEDAIALFKSACHYCGCPPSQITTGHRVVNPVPFVYNGIDRKDPAIGYLPENVVSCCKMCNFAKRNVPYSEFLEWLCRAAFHLGVRG